MNCFMQISPYIYIHTHTHTQYTSGSQLRYAAYTFSIDATLERVAEDSACVYFIFNSKPLTDDGPDLTSTCIHYLMVQFFVVFYIT